MDSLNSDVLGEIVAYLSFVDVTRLANTSKYFQNNTWQTVKQVDARLGNDRLNFLLSRNLACISSVSLTEDLTNIHASSLHPLTNLTSLRSLAIKYNQTILKNDILDIFTTLTQLECIKWHYQMFEADVPAIFARHKKLTELQGLFDPSILHDWSQLIQLKKLSAFGLYSYYTETQCNISPLTNLTSLNIDNSALQQEDIDGLTNLTNLRELTTGKNIIGHDFMRCFPNLVYINLYNSADVNIEAISTQLTKLVFYVEDATARIPKSSLLTNLKQLTMTYPPIKSIMSRISEFQFTDLKNLRKLRMSDRKLIAKLEAAKLTNLRQLIMERPLTKKELVTVCQLTTLQKLTIRAHARDTPLLDYETFFENASNLVNLESLVFGFYDNLEGQSLQPEFVQFLQPLTRLTYLQLPLLLPTTAKQITVLTQLIELNVKTISQSQVDLVKTFPFRVVYKNASSNIK